MQARTAAKTINRPSTAKREALINMLSLASLVVGLLKMTGRKWVQGKAGQKKDVKKNEFDAKRN